MLANRIPTLSVALSFVGGSLLLFAIYLYSDVSAFINLSERTTGEVVRLDERWDTDSDGARSKAYYPEFSYKVEGRNYSVVSNSGSNPSSFRIGEQVEVLYNPNNPIEGRINSFLQLYIMPFCFGIMGFALACSSLILFLFKHKIVQEEFSNSS